MTRLLDARTSQNASYGNTISIPLPVNTAGAIAELGLDVTECPLLCECLRNKPKRCQVVTINASDYNIPLPPSNELVYTLYIFCTADATRIGIESFNAVAYSD